MKRILVFLLALPLTAAAFISCGSTVGQQQTYNCCPRNVMQFYSCPDKDSFAKCYNESNATACTPDPTRDIGCPALWPGGPANQHK